MAGQPNHPDPQALAAQAQQALNLAARAIYQKMANDYDRHLLDDCGYASPAAVALQIEEVGIRTDELLDIGAGTGLLGQALVQRGVQARITAVDLVPSMLLKNHCTAYANRIAADAAHALPFPASAFDAAVAVGLMEHVLNPRTLFAECLRVIKDEGVAVLTFVPNTSGRTELFDRNAGLLSHDSRQMSDIVERLSAQIVDRRQFNAYQNGGQWVKQESIAIQHGG